MCCCHYRYLDNKLSSLPQPPHILYTLREIYVWRKQAMKLSLRPSYCLSHCRDCHHTVHVVAPPAAHHTRPRWVRLQQFRQSGCCLPSVLSPRTSLDWEHYYYFSFRYAKLWPKSLFHLANKKKAPNEELTHEFCSRACAWRQQE